jgi:endoglucanase
MRRIRAVVLVASTVLAAAAALTVTGSPAQADTQICAQFGSAAVSGGKYIVQNNEWGDTSPQCITATDTGFSITTASHNLPTNGAPAAYPSIYAGCHYGNCSSGSGLPMQVSNPAFGNVTTGVTMSYPNAGQWDAAYDIWFDPTARTDGQNTGAELMVWLNHAGAPQPVGSPVGTVSIAGGTWTVWEGNIGWNVVSYVRTAATGSITFAVKDFYNDMVGRGYAQNSWYLTSVQAGFEPWVGQTGLAVNSFSYSTTGNGGGGGTGGQTVVGQGSNRCLDIKDFGTADGTPVQLWDCAGGWNQLWTYTGGALVNPSSGKCLDVASGGTANGTQARLWSCNGTGAQQWQRNGNGTITNPQSGRCLDAVAQGTANGTPLQIWDCYGSGTQANQVWSFR